jgi:hypothetical protein
MSKDLVVGLNAEGNTVRVVVKHPSPKDYRDAQLVYNKAFREALESGAMLKQKLQDYIVSQGIWDDKKQKEYENLVEQINSSEDMIKAGGFKLGEAKQIALKLRELRGQFRVLISERQSYDSVCAEGQADNARFNFLVTKCVFREDGVSKVWETAEAYDESGSEDWAIKAASKLAEIMYGLDADYDKKLEENKFLIKYKFAREDLRLVNKEGHLVDADGRLINEEGRFVAYREDGTQYFVNRDGQEVSDTGDKKIEFKPFLDDDGNPIVEDEQVACESGEAEGQEKSSKKRSKKADE